MKSFAAILIASTTQAMTYGEIGVELNGVEHKVFVVADQKFSHALDVNENSLTFKHGVRAYLASTDVSELIPTNYLKINLFDKELSYDVDMSTVGCSCNAALYFVSMPAS